MLYHLGILRGIYRDVLQWVVTKMFTVYLILSLIHLVFGRYFRSVYVFSFLGHFLEVLGRSF